ncbi:MAG TPA: VWA domain-containing protein [Thermoanaerobaculia bacterium]|nr:VWA domain-containing protein [Thermoanaerobaculia bacterium]
MRSAGPQLGALAVLASGSAGCVDDVRIGRPDLLWLLWLAPALALFLVWSYRRRERSLREFAAPDLLARLASGVSRPRRFLKASLLVLALGAGLLALSDVRVGYVWEEVRRRGVDIVVALDVSDSMLVEDAAAGDGLSRLERARREISDLLGLLRGDRIALVAFAGTAFLELPLTLDYGAADLFLDSLEPDLIPIKGTMLDEALRKSIEAFEGSAQESRAIIMITDGEDHSGRALEVARQAAQEGIRVFAIGIGRDEGAPIPQENGGFRRDRSGEVILSRLDERTLQQIALETGGSYVRSVTGDADLEQIYLQGIKATLQDRELGATRQQRWRGRFQWLVAVAAAALMIEPLIADRAHRIRGDEPLVR